MARYRFDAGHSRFTVEAFASGLLSFLGHSPVFVVQEFTGELRWEPSQPHETALEVTINANSLSLQGNARPADRKEIENRMRYDVLEVANFPQIAFDSTDVTTTAVAEGRFRAHMVGLMTLRGVTKQETIDAELFGFADGIRLRGQCSLGLSDYRIRPVTALGGAIRLRDELRVAFDIVGWKDAA